MILKIDEDEFLEMLSNYWAWQNNTECEKATKKYCKKIGVSEHNFACWTGEKL